LGNGSEEHEALQKDGVDSSKGSKFGRLFESFASNSNRHDSVRSDNSDYEIVAVKDSKIYKKYRFSNFWAVIILASVAIDCNYLALPYPFKLSPGTVIAFVLLSSMAGLISSYFVQRVSDETGLSSLEEIMYFFGNRVSFYAIGLSMFAYYSFRSAEYLCNFGLFIVIDFVIIIIMKYLRLDLTSSWVYVIWITISVIQSPMVYFRKI
jgi:hypothetical protein